MQSSTSHSTTALESALLVGIDRGESKAWTPADSLEELAELAKSAGAQTTKTILQKLRSPTPALYIGRGKAQALAQQCITEKIQLVIFDDELTPAQNRNLSGIFQCKVLDRTQLILDIFAQRAKSREGKLQIELAQLQYLLPRLTGMWTHLSRQAGGIGLRGPGETQLEVDRRRVQERISRLIKELASVRQQRSIAREGRRHHHWPVASLVGYTNAGKSTLLNRLTHAEVYAADRLFATLDPTTRQLMLPNKQKMLLSDTVGFLQRLPHHLIEAFKATLEEVQEADLLLHVVDASHPQMENQIAAVDSVLEELGCAGKQTIFVFNKADQVKKMAFLAQCVERHSPGAAISALTGVGMEDLLSEIEHQLRAWRLHMQLRLPNDQTALVAEIHRIGRVLEMRYRGNWIHLTAHVPPQLQGRLKSYIVSSDDADDSRNGARRTATRTTPATRRSSTQNQ